MDPPREALGQDRPGADGGDPSESLRILHVIRSLASRYGGPPKACIEMAEAVAHLGHRVSIYTTNQDGSGCLDVPLDRPVVKNGVEVSYFAVQPPRFFGTSFTLAQALRRHISLFDVVHIHSLYLFHGAAAGHYCRKAGVPYIVRPHGTLDPYMFRRHRYRKLLVEIAFERRNIKDAALLHFTAEEEKVLARPYSLGTVGVVVPNGVRVDDYSSLPARGGFRAKHPVLMDKTIVLFLGRIHSKKGFDLLIPAFSTVVEERPDAHLVIAGPDDEGYGVEVRALVDASGVHDHVTFTGLVTGSEKLALLADADMFVLPSYSENFGIAVAEAMACQLPVVVSDKVNIWREVLDAQAGVVVPCQRDRVAGAIIRVIDSDERKAMGRRGRRLVEERFQWKHIAPQLVSMYKEAARFGTTFSDDT